jgi:flagellar biosynthesis/type III secretory pathway M-ring protein FliF/YscJ
MDLQKWLDSLSQKQQYGLIAMGAGFVILVIAIILW